MAKNDDKIKALLGKVEEQKGALGVKPRAAWQTNGIFKYRDGSHFNLNTVRDSQPLVEALASILEREALLAQAAERLGTTAKPLIWDGYSLAEWESDFRKRIEILAWEEKKARLEDTKKKLNSLVSEEAKTEMELTDIETLLG